MVRDFSRKLGPLVKLEPSLSPIGCSVPEACVWGDSYILTELISLF